MVVRKTGVDRAKLFYLLGELSRLAVEPHFPRRAGFGKRDEVPVFRHARKLHPVAANARRHVLVIEQVAAEILPVAQH